MQRAVLLALWVAAAGGVSLAAVALYELKRTPAVRPEPIPIDRLPARAPYQSLNRWTVTEHLSAHHVLIAQVETDYLAEAVAIAQQLTEPVKNKYAEVLIYFHRPGRPDSLPPRRVQWTLKSGYVETRFE